MGLGCYNLKYISDIIKLKLNNSKTLQVLSLGYPDILITKDEMKRFLTNEEISRVKLRDDSINIAALQNNEEFVDWCCESYSFFEILGAKLTVFDFTNWSEKEIIIDLNVEIPKEYHNKYDLIIDPGTTEHIFNLPQAMSNILKMSKIDGYIYHSTPFCEPNHGFFSISPTLYYDFYDTNGAKVIKCTKQTQYGEDEISLHPREVFFTDKKGVSSVVVKKNQDVKNIVYPIQGKYQNTKLNKSNLNKVIDKIKTFSNIALVPYNGNARFLEELLCDYTLKIYDDNDILNKYLNIEKIEKIIEFNYDIIIITSLTFEDRIRKKLISLGIKPEKIILQV